MTIIKSSENSGPITVVIFTTDEIKALEHLLDHAKFDNSTETHEALEVLDEFLFTLNILPTVS